MQIKEMKSQALLVIEDCENYWGIDNHPCHRFLIHDLYRGVANLIAKRENHSDNCCLYETGHSPFYQKSRINVQNNATLSSLAKENLCKCSSEAKIMRVVSCSKISRLDLKGLDLRSLEIRHCPKLREVNVHHLAHLACLLWEGCAAVKFPSLKKMTSLKLLIIQGVASNSPSMGRLPEVPGCLPSSKISTAKMDPPNLRECVHLQVLHLSFLPDLLEFPHLGHLKHLVKLEAASCPKVQSLGDLTRLTSLEHLYLSNFESLEELPGLGELKALKHLNITNCIKVRDIPVLQNLTNLMHLCLDELPIEQIPGIEHLVKLQQLRCRHSNLKSLPDLRLVTELKHLDVSYTPVSNLDRVGTLKKLKKLEAVSCRSMDKLPNLPSFPEVDVRNSLYEQLHNKNSRN
jgi:Leucine-rich repeat (LRR) protein